MYTKLQSKHSTEVHTTQPIRLTVILLYCINETCYHNLHYLTYLTPDMKNKLLITAAITIYTFYNIC